MCDDKGFKNYEQLATLAKCILTLSHGNADPEQVNKHLLNIHSPAIGEETITALRLLEDFIVRSGVLLSVVVTKSLIRDCQIYNALYTAQRLEEARQKELVEADAE